MEPRSVNPGPSLIGNLAFRIALSRLPMAEPAMPLSPLRFPAHCRISS